jgi:DMSO/TMAO reductase YedYZ molybdopterin-dependent catalytic subunit
MKTRREFIDNLLRIFFLTAGAAGFGLSRVRSAFAEIKKRILPATTNPKSLFKDNPEYLDTRNLKVMPLDEFNTMGDTDRIVDTKTWRLEVTGAVKTPLALTLSEIRALPVVERNVLLVCPGVFSNHGSWKGISVKELANRAGVDSGVDRVYFHGLAAFGDKEEVFKIDEIASDQVFLAYGVNGEPLPREHGFPLRVVAEGHWGHEWAKYVHTVRFVLADA